MYKYTVFVKGTSTLVYQYEAESRIVWDQFPLDAYDYVQSELPVVTPPNTHVFGGRRKLTHLEFRSLLHTDEQESIDEFTATFESNSSLPTATKRRIRTMMKKYSEATLIDLDDPDNAAGLGLYVSLGAMAYPRIAEVLNG